jgi:predicted Rossmann fold flavoprotein
MNPPKVAVIGAGAAGMTAAIFAARGGADVVLVDASTRPGTKILISGGGRCNVLPGEFRADAFVSSGSTNVLKRIFKTWPHKAVRRFFEDELGVPLELEEESGKLFPQANKAKAVHQALMTALEEEGVELHKDWKVESIAAVDHAANVDSETHSTRFILRNQSDARIEVDRVIFAAGGRSVPKTGSDGSGYRLAEELGHELTPTYPGLVPLVAPNGWWSELAGLAHGVKWSAMRGQKCVGQGEGNLLFTHFGFSGPAALNASHWYARDACKIIVAWNGWSEAQWQERIWNPSDQQNGSGCGKGRSGTGNRRHIARTLSRFIPRRLCGALLQHCQIEIDQDPAQLKKEKRRELLQALSAFELPLTGTRGYDYAEVTGGGIALSEINPSTLQSRRRDGIYFCGEILDVIGDIGGHNFLWAWVTGKLAGTHAAKIQA